MPPIFFGTSIESGSFDETAMQTLFMDNLFLILGLILAVIIVVGAVLIFIGKHRRSSKTDMAERPERDLYADRYFEENPIEPVSTNKIESLFEAPVIGDEAVQTLDEETAPSAENHLDNPPEPKPARKSEMIIVLYVIAQRKTGFAGADVLTALEDLGLKYGNMRIFHHYGIGELKVQQPVFSIANMVEPGTFNPQRISNLTTPGLALFMRLPGPFGGRVAFELMLNNGQKMAEWLGGTLEDERHAELTPQTISRLRERIANFEQRSTNLSILKRLTS